MSCLPERTIAIVSGLPRSGTSLMIQMLEAGGIPVLTDHERQADDDNPRGYYEFEPVKKIQTDTSWLPQAEGNVVKMVYLLLYHLPSDWNYKVVFMQRDLREVVHSQQRMLDRQGKKGGGLGQEQLMQVCQRQLEDIRRWLESRECFQVLDVKYNDLMADPQPVIERLNVFFDGSLDVAKMGSVIDQSLYRNRQASECLE